MRMLVVFHTPVNEGYAMSTLEKTFFEVAKDICESPQNVYFAFSDFNGEASESLPADFNNVFEINPVRLKNPDYFEKVKNNIQLSDIDIALCFDLPVANKVLDVLNESGVSNIVSYWGASMSGINSGIKLLAKRIEIFFRKKKPDLFIFESESMRFHATNGRGLPKKKTRVIHTGIDTDVFSPSRAMRSHYLKEFDIAPEKKIAIYSGHMEHRKGVHVLIDAMLSLADTGKNNWHLIICGNRPGEENQFLDMLQGSEAINSVTFCGYRSDLGTLLPSCDIGVIASVGWDSFPMSAIEMASSGLPVVASDLQGLKESVVDGETGFLFEPGDHESLAEILIQLGRDDDKLQEMSRASRARSIKEFSIDAHKKQLSAELRNLLQIKPRAEPFQSAR